MGTLKPGSRFGGWHLAGVALAGCLGCCGAEEVTGMEWPEHIQQVLDETRPLKTPLGDALPLYLWPARNPGPADDARALDLVRELARRGIGLVCSWNAGNPEATLANALPYARAQVELGLRVNIDATGCVYGFCDGTEGTAHLDEDGNPFFDDSFGRADMGCPFRQEHRIPVMRERIAQFVRAYQQAGLPVDFVFADWEVDGPLEWNRAWDVARRCTVCREELGTDHDFLTYQDRLRRLRSRFQRQAYAEPVLSIFPEALVGNYAVYAHDGWRYWYDYFERYVPGQPALRDQNARYRHWANDFEATGYTFGMPVVYPWSWTWNWYGFEPGQYRWFYNGLLVASNAGAHKPPHGVPIIPFVHWHTVDVGLSCDESSDPVTLETPEQMTEFTYRELLWHMLLRGSDTFFLWCQGHENIKEVRLLHGVWAEARDTFAEFLDHGTPVTFAVPSQPGPVVSGLLLGNRLLVRRTDFGSPEAKAVLTLQGRELTVPATPGECRVLSLD